MPLRRLFLLGAATLASAAALVAIATILSGGAGETEWHIFATLATTFVAGSTAIAGLALLGRRESRPVAVATVALALAGFAIWTAGIWTQAANGSLAKLAGVITAWALALLVVTMTRLMLSTPALVRRLYPATVAAAFGAALVATGMILRDAGDGWQLFGVLLVLALLGEALAPLLERFRAAGDRHVERVLGVVGGVEVIAVRGRARGAVQIGATSSHLSAGESVVVRERV